LARTIIYNRTDAGKSICISASLRLISNDPPDISVPVFTDEDIAAKRDPALMKALALLAGKDRS